MTGFHVILLVVGGYLVCGIIVSSIMTVIEKTTESLEKATAEFFWGLALWPLLVLYSIFLGLSFIPKAYIKFLLGIRLKRANKIKNKGEITA